MKLVKWLLIAVLGLAAVLFVGGLFLSPQFKVTRSITIAAPADKIYALIADPRAWNRWAVWNQRDPQMKIEYSGPPSGKGATWAWQSKSEGDGRMTFTEAVPGRHVIYELYFPDFGTTSHGEIEIAPDGAGHRVTWAMNGNMGRNPLFRWLALNADSMVGNDFDAGLANLKALAEKP
ncbi:SRPBCC family protein [Aquabacterium humicola]|uniref:SRPBCC family protein n=1 Tax=Aquabacterium humicola TaxID=3237377 RepID=UPI0025433443|nr:SRPBCC family protein [Rubrivivax pictus]